MSRLEVKEEPQMRHSASFEAFGTGFAPIGLGGGGGGGGHHTSDDFDDAEFNDFDSEQVIVADPGSSRQGPASGFFVGGGFNVTSIVVTAPEDGDGDGEPKRSSSPTPSFIEFGSTGSAYEVDPSEIGTSLDDWDESELNTLAAVEVVPTGAVSSLELEEMKSEGLFWILNFFFFFFLGRIISKF